MGRTDARYRNPTATFFFAMDQFLSLVTPCHGNEVYLSSNTNDDSIIVEPRVLGRGEGKVRARSRFVKLRETAVMHHV